MAINDFNNAPRLKGLTPEEAQQRISQYGYNVLEEKERSFLYKMGKWMISPISLMLLGAATLSELSGRTFDFYTIIFLFFLNFFITFWQEKKADTAIKQLKKHLATKVNVFRNDNWFKIDSKELVPGDVIRLSLGNIVPADIKIAEARNLTVNNSAITGESLPKTAAAGEIVYSGAIVDTGQLLATVQATGFNTYFGKTLASAEKIKKSSLLEQDILSISKLLSGLSLFAIAILTAVLLLSRQSLMDTLTLDLSLLIAGIPISLPTVMTLIISFGVLELAKKDAIVRRISSLEDLANVEIILSDKTGTLTKNKLSVQKIIGYETKEEDVLTQAYLCAVNDEDSPISRAVIDKFTSTDIKTPEAKIISFIPADSDNKRSTAEIKIQDREYAITFGATQVIGALCDGSAILEEDVRRAALKGWRTLAVAVKEKGKWSLSGLISVADELWEDTKDVVTFLKNQGVEVKMVTGDNRAIAQHIGKELDLDPKDIFAEVMPSDKYDLVLKEKQKYIVASTGDGVNDLPALKAANVGIAVESAVDALKGSADIVLLSPGLAVIKDAIIESRKIFQRLYSYSVYRISESLRLILSILILGLIFKSYPLTPVQLILLALLNDIPIISLAFNRVQLASKPAKIRPRRRLFISSTFGLVGVANSVIFFFLATFGLKLEPSIVMTLFFLKLAIGGHMLIYVAHTEKPWYKFLPSKTVITATITTQLIATIMALNGIFMSKAPLSMVAFVWIWAFFWMQITELSKQIIKNISKSY